MARRAKASSPDRARAASRSCPWGGTEAAVALGGSGGFCCIANTALAAACVQTIHITPALVSFLTARQCTCFTYAMPADMTLL